MGITFARNKGERETHETVPIMDDTGGLGWIDLDDADGAFDRYIIGSNNPW